MARRRGDHGAMTGFLASVRSADEAAIAVACGADIVDAKEPAEGALGAVSPSTLTAILAAVGGRCPVSATIGDVPLVPEAVRGAVEATAARGADIVKIGVFAGAVEPTFSALGGVAARGVRLVAVLFADRAPELDAMIARCRQAGFYGIMLDTALKESGTLTRHLGMPVLARFVAGARSAGLASGLAGSLRLDDVPSLAALGPDYLGFRSALTTRGRSGAIDRAATADIRRALDVAQPRASSIATATAGAMSAASGRSRSSATGTIVSKRR